MASASCSFKSREDHRRQIELDAARKAGLAPAEVDEDGKEINPHIPEFVSKTPWYYKGGEKPSLNHQKSWKKSDHTKDTKTKLSLCYDRGAKTFQAQRFRKGSCDNCGAMTHAEKSCPERPRKNKAKFTNKNIAADEKIESLDLSYDGKRDRWKGYDPSHYHLVVERYEAKEEARKKFLKEQKIKKLESSDGADQKEEEEEDDDDELRVDEAKVDESKQKGFAKVEKRVRTTGGGSTGTVRNLRIREDTAKYLLNLDTNSAHYDPKSRSMREDPLPNADPNEKFYLGDNHYRNSGQALEFKQLNVHAWDRFARGQDLHMQAAPSQAQLLYDKFKVAKEKLKSQTNDAITAKYGDAATKDEIPMELLLGQSERQVEYDRAGRIIKGQDVVVLPKSKYEEDVYVNNHTSVWGSWWKDHQWGYKCCQQTIRNSYCTGSAGIEAAEAVLDLMKANVARREAVSEESAKKEVKGKKRMVSWGSDVPEDLELSEEALKNALKKEDERKKEEKDERKRKYNVKYSNEVTPEEMEAHRMKRLHHEDPMKNFL